MFRIRYSDISETYFTWRAEVSSDCGKTWTEVQVVEARRAEKERRNGKLNGIDTTHMAPRPATVTFFATTQFMSIEM